MKPRRLRSTASHAKLTVMFLAVLVPPAVTLIWLGLQLLEQDRTLQERREIEWRQAASEGIVRVLAQSLADLENRAGPLPEGVLRVIVSPLGVRGIPAERMLWTEKAAEIGETPTEPFNDAEIAEYHGESETALRSYRELSNSNDTSIRAGALLRMARVERQQPKIDHALHTYESLGVIRDIAFNGAPVDLLARREICRLLKDSGRLEQLRLNAEALETDFLANRWELDRTTWFEYSVEIEQWLGRPVAVSSDRKALTAAAEWVWQTSRNGSLMPSGSRTIALENLSITLLWRTEITQDQSPQLEATVITPTVVQSLLDKTLQGASAKAGRVSLLADSGELLSGDFPDSSGNAIPRKPIDTGLPWTIVLSANDASRSAVNPESRRHLLGWGLAAILLFLAGGGYFLLRVIGRELAVARLQTDFVGTVSHEFRTPLTSMRHITELLQEDDELPMESIKEQRQTFYAALARNTDRLHRLVESLLDFSRMETGRKPWHLQTMDGAALVTEVISEFRKEVTASTVRIEFTKDTNGGFFLQADADALGHALWNLLDNAVKYSRGGGVVRVSMKHSPQGIVISVIDEGLGIPTREQRQIFRKFVRGEKAVELGIKGTGLGLAIVSHIVQAHRGAVELESQEGKGSVFRVVLPADSPNSAEADLARSRDKARV